MNLRKLLATPIHVPARLLVISTAVLLLAAGALWQAGAGLRSPYFVLDRSQGSVSPVDYPAWRRLSDWLARRKYVVLTFDDGPYGSGVDERILGILRHHDAHAIFFLVCSHVTIATSRVLGEIEQNGDLIGNHSYDHPHLNPLDQAGLQRQIGGCSAQIGALTGHRPRFFRPPFGETSPRIMQVVHSAGMQQVLWDANSEDSWQKRRSQIIYWSLEQTSNGSILLMHDDPTTAAALDEVLTKLEKRGFRFVLPVEPHPVSDVSRQEMQSTKG